MVKPPRDTPLDRTARLLNLVPYLLSHQGIEINSLAKIFEIPTQQLIEDLNTLWMCGLPGYTPLELMDLTFDNGFVTISNAETLQRPRSLTRDEALALILGLDYLSGQIADSAGSLQEALTRLTGKIATSLGEAAQSQVRVSSNISAITRALIIKTIAERGSLLITYHSIGRDVISERKIHPLEFTFENEGEHLFATAKAPRDIEHLL